MKKFTFINDIQVVKDDLGKAEIRKYWTSGTGKGTGSTEFIHFG